MIILERSRSKKYDQQMANTKNISFQKQKYDQQMANRKYISLKKKDTPEISVSSIAQTSTLCTATDGAETVTSNKTLTSA